MRRVAIIGPGGAGKSVLARQLGPRTGLPVIHLDREFWQPGWVAVSAEQKRNRLQEICAADTWITDGNYGGSLDVRLARADTVVFLDLHPWRCAARAWRRWWRHRHDTRPDLAPGCPEKPPSRDFLGWILTYRRERRPRVMERLAQLPPGVAVHVLRTPRQVRTFLRDLPAPPAAAPATAQATETS